MTFFSSKRRSIASQNALSFPEFRHIWIGSIFNNFGTIILGVSAGWAMTELTDRADLITLIQTAILGPTLLLGWIAGSVADVFQRKIVAIWSLIGRLICVTLLILLVGLNLLTAPMLLIICCVIGASGAFFFPSWQTSVRQQVSPSAFPHAISLNSVSANIARTIGPALGGLVIAYAGITFAFGSVFIATVPIIFAFVMWEHKVDNNEDSNSLVPRERLPRAVADGLQYLGSSPEIKALLLRSFVIGLAASSTISLAPVIAKSSLGGDATVFGSLLAAMGIGAVIGALNLTRIRRKLSSELTVGLCACIGIIGSLVIAFSTQQITTMVGFFLSGLSFTISSTLVNISIQTQSAHWVMGRIVSYFQAVTAGGLAIGGLVWGIIAVHWGVSMSLILTCIAFFMWILMGTRYRLNDHEPSEFKPVNPASWQWNEELLAEESGAIVVEVRYVIASHNQAKFVQFMSRVGNTRKRNGARNWNLTQEVTAPENWLERFTFNKWRDLLLFRSRSSESEMTMYKDAQKFHNGPEPITARLLLAVEDLRKSPT